jgi:PQQ-like domain/Dockerin type I domain
VGSDDVDVYCLNASSGAFVWRYTTGGTVDSSPAVADGKVYVGSFDNTVYCFGSSGLDVSVTNVTSVKTIIGQGYGVNITVTVQYLGDFTENFVTTYANLTAIGTLNFDLTNGSIASKTFAWNTTGFAFGNYTLWTYAEPVPGETNAANNNCTCSVSVHIGVPGDINSDGIVDMRDVMSAVQAFNSFPSTSRWSPYADVDGNSRVDTRDILVIVLHFNQHE